MADGLIAPEYMTQFMPADILTKALSRERVSKCREMLGVLEMVIGRFWLS